MTARRLHRMRQTLERRQPDLQVLLDQVHKPHNLSAILRTCDAVGVPRAHAVSRHQDFTVHRAASSGTGQWVAVETHADLPAAVRAVQGQGMKVYAAHLSEQAVDYRQVDYTKPCCLLLGAEKEGVSEEGAALADGHVIIPMFGLGASLNVSVAAAVILFEAQRQRLAAGQYETPRMAEAEITRTLVEWLHPRIAERCRKEGRPYPALDEDGGVIWTHAPS
ncbi:tRNA (guanosine(18)-2'-O)-methyltransferase TrmH [Alkalilimnicola ehrlichii MLHE-1]|uniref:tRNA (guanosine(18)-2'-O)-methyltransferase n=1 Tax=Alkalilimnicola ehrlichii (strain ATCC BAA-1101 / DSM 17681 / MLHE-1) TaxID=187272 RepID=Q0AB97_ALKEH|nr:tRNA (guanosine(18)-2'-O)-methyltransferase TrmH [Alkalilimnicola ehrlichii]ABI55890.1 tRNA guanosine-2'-O-methyltransferase [Alkalilimnicola ehrlichii MLHE-1]